MNRFAWKEIVRKTKWASGKKRLTNQELINLQRSAVALEKFLGKNKSDFADIDRRERRIRKAEEVNA